jgi:hypothetical protein
MADYFIFTGQEPIKLEITESNVTIKVSSGKVYLSLDKFKQELKELETYLANLEKWKEKKK